MGIVAYVIAAIIRNQKNKEHREAILALTPGYATIHLPAPLWRGKIKILQVDGIQPLVYRDGERNIWRLPPGIHRVVCGGEGTGLSAGQLNPVELEVEVESGADYSFTYSGSECAYFLEKTGKGETRHPIKLRNSQFPGGVFF